jgi:hypothetical protein
MQNLQNLHKLCLSLTDADFAQRLEVLAKEFLGVSYGAWRDGSSLESLDDFNYDLNLLDCVLYVEVVVTLAKIDPRVTLDQFVHAFENLLRKIHYLNGEPSYLARNHIHCVDWIQNNKFMFDDITCSLSSSYKVAETLIDKLSWLKRQKPCEGVSAFPEHIAQAMPIQQSQVPYIASEEILTNYSHFVATFPEYSIVNIVRPNWDITERIGTHLNISHLGFAIKDRLSKDQSYTQIKFYHATIEKNEVVQETLDVYLQRHLSSPTIRGINILAVSPGYWNGR